VLMADKGLDYSVSVVLEMPESAVNRQSGMFLMCLHMKASSGESVRSECRSTMLHYRSELLRAIETLVLAPLFMTGHILESQKLTVTFADDYRDDPLMPVVAIDLQILSRFVEVYSVRFLIHARFTGLRYIMFHFPILSAVIGTLLQVIVLSVIILFSWCKVFEEGQLRAVEPVRPASSSGLRKSSESCGKQDEAEEGSEKDQQDDKADGDISLRRRVQVIN
jgi:seipin